MSSYEKYREEILNVIQKADRPLSIENVRTRVGIKIWETAKALLLELLVEGKILGLKTGKSWVFGRPETMTPVMILKKAHKQ